MAKKRRGQLMVMEEGDHPNPAMEKVTASRTVWRPKKGREYSVICCRFAPAFEAETDVSSKGKARPLVVVITVVLEDRGRMR
jgi:hypothetical protein